MRIEGAIFDLDGTLMDSMFIWDNIGSEYLLSRGITPREDLNQTFKNMSLYQAALYYQSEYGLAESTDEIVNGVNQRIEHLYQNEVPVKKGVPELLYRLETHGIKMCIATATDRHLAEAALIRNNIRRYFGEIFTCHSIGHGKDEPHIFLTALDYLKTPKSATWIFEDALYAVKTAKNSGFPIVGIYDTSENYADQVKALSDLYIHSFEEMEGYLNEESIDDRRI